MFSLMCIFKLLTYQTHMVIVWDKITSKLLILGYFAEKKKKKKIGFVGTQLSLNRVTFDN